MYNTRLIQIYFVLFTVALLLTFLHQGLSDHIIIPGLAFAVAIFGLPHGALDLLVARSLRIFTSFWGAFTFALVYLLVAGFSIMFWLWAPALGLGLFLAISVYHFSADWRATYPLYNRLSIAAFILCGPSILYDERLFELFTALLVSAPNAQMIILIMRIGCLLALLISVVSLFLTKRSAQNQNTLSRFEPLALIVSSIFLPPLIHFVLYFCALHSTRHMFDVAKHLNLSFRKSLLLSLPLVVVTLAIAGVAYYFIALDSIETNLLRWTFIGLFGLTMSHMLLIGVWHEMNARATR